MKGVVAVLLTILLYLLGSSISHATVCKWDASLEVETAIMISEFRLDSFEIRNPELIKKISSFIIFLRELREEIKPIPEKRFYPAWVILREEMYKMAKEIETLWDREYER